MIKGVYHYNNDNKEDSCFAISAVKTTTLVDDDDGDAIKIYTSKIIVI